MLFTNIVFALIASSHLFAAPALPTSQVMFEKRDVPSDGHTFLSLSQGIFNAQNRARVDPAAFSKELATYGDQTAAQICLTQTPVPNGNLIYFGGLRQSSAAYYTTSGQSLSTRISQFGSWHSIIAENVVYGPATAMSVVAALIKNQGFSANVFNPAYQHAGISCGADSTYGTVCVIDYAGSFTPNN